MSKICNSSVVRSITSTGWLWYIGSCRLKRAWSNSCRLGVPYNLLRSLSMAGGLSFLNPRLSVPVLFIPPEWYVGSMDLSNIC